MVQHRPNAYSKSPTRHLRTHHTAWSHRSLTKLIIINHHWHRNTWEHIPSTPIWTNFTVYGNLEIAIKTQPWHHRRKSNTPLESSSCSIDKEMCRLLEPRVKIWSLGWPSCQWSHLAWNANALEHPIRIGLSWFEASKLWNDVNLSAGQLHSTLGKNWKMKFSSNSCIPHGKSYFRRQEINFSSESPNQPSLDFFNMKQLFWKRNKEKKWITLKLRS